MANFLTNIGLLAGQNPFLAYFIIYLVTIFLGNISAFASLWLALRGYLGTWGVPWILLTIFAAEATGDLLWYALGRTLRETRFGNFVKNHLPGHSKIEQNLERNGRNWIFLSKFLYGSTFPIIFLVGWTKTDFKKFFQTSLVALLLWLPILTGLAYGLIFSLTPLGAIAAFKVIFKKFEFVFFFGLGLFVVADYFLAKAFKIIAARRFLRENDGSTNLPSFDEPS